MQKILLHSCCAVCAAYPLEKLENYITTVYFCNPNIYPEQEYIRRLDELKHYCDKHNFELIIEEYNPQEWYDFIKGLENEPEKGLRCEKCFEFRLEKSAQKTKELGIENLTTTLTVSPHKDSQKIFQIGIKISQKYGIKFIQENFKKQNGFFRTTQLAKENNFYRQNYCGCEYSIKKPTEDKG